MKPIVASLCLMIIVTIGTTARAQTKQDDEGLRGLPQAFSNAFNKHDGHELAQIMADNDHACRKDIRAMAHYACRTLTVR